MIKERWLYVSFFLWWLGRKDDADVLANDVKHLHDKEED